MTVLAACRDALSLVTNHNKSKNLFGQSAARQDQPRGRGVIAGGEYRGAT